MINCAGITSGINSKPLLPRTFFVIIRLLLVSNGGHFRQKDKTMKYPMKYVFQNDVQETLDIFTSLFDIRIAFFSTSGRELRIGQKRDVCTFCRLLRKKLGYDSDCLKLDSRMRAKAARERKLMYYRCHGGMSEAIMPIFLEDDLIGFLMAGQFRTPGNTLSRRISKQWKDKFGTDELDQAYNDAPYFEKDYAANIVKLFSTLIDHFLYRHMIELYGNTSVQPLINYMRAHYEEHLGLEDASRILMQSQSSLSHKFKQLTGKSFNQFQIDLKLDKADEYFEKQPEMLIKEVAFRLGYSDPYYFSRLYRKNRGRSPRQAKKQFQQLR